VQKPTDPTDDTVFGAPFGVPAPIM